MSDVVDEAQAIVECKGCSWYKSCVLPLRVTEQDMKRQIESAMSGVGMQAGAFGMSQLLSGMAAAAQNSFLEGCPIFIERLRSNPRLAERIKKMMQDWSKSGDGPSS